MSITAVQLCKNLSQLNVLHISDDLVGSNVQKYGSSFADVETEILKGMFIIYFHVI